MSQFCGPALAHTLILCLGSVTFGFILSFPSPAEPQMRTEFPSVSNNSRTLFNSISSLVAIFGPFLVNVFLAPPLQFGRRLSMFAFAVSGAGFWLLLLGTSEKAFWIGIFARALLGITLGTFSALTPIYVVELSPPDLTGFFGSFPQLFIATGVTICYLVGTWVNWRTLAMVGAGIDVALAVLVWWVPESPASPDGGGGGENLCAVKWIGRLTVGCLFTIFQQFTGINNIITGLSDLFTKAHVPIPSGYASAIASAAQVIASSLAAAMIAKFGRRPIWVVSFATIVVTDVAYAVSVSPLQDKRHIFPSWVPILFIFANQFGFALGAGPIPWFVVAEMFPDFVRPMAVSLSASACWLFTFISIEVSDPLSNTIGDWGTFLIYAAVSGVALVFGIFAIREPEVVPEKLEDRGTYELVSGSTG
jgi:MFS family permease